MKNLLKFLLFVWSAERRHFGPLRLPAEARGLNLVAVRRPEKYTLASAPSVEPKEVASLDAFNRERRALVTSGRSFGGQHQDVEEGSDPPQYSWIHSSFSTETPGNSGIRARKRWCRILSAPGVIVSDGGPHHHEQSRGRSGGRDRSAVARWAQPKGAAWSAPMRWSISRF